jgi:hypothetical protein
MHGIHMNDLPVLIFKAKKTAVALREKHSAPIGTLPTDGRREGGRGHDLYYDGSWDGHGEDYCQLQLRG